MLVVFGSGTCHRAEQLVRLYGAIIESGNPSLNSLMNAYSGDSSHACLNLKGVFFLLALSRHSL